MVSAIPCTLHTKKELPLALQEALQTVVYCSGLDEVFRSIRSLGTFCSFLDVVQQDEYTQDVLLQWDTTFYLVLDTT